MIIRISLGTCSVLAPVLSLLPVIFVLWNIAVEPEMADMSEPPALPAFGDFAPWSRGGSPMDCLLTSKRAELALRYGYFGSYQQPRRSLRISVEHTTAIEGDLVEDEYLFLFRRDGTFHVEGLSREAGLRHFRDFIGASLHPETELFFDRSAGWEKKFFSAPASSSCGATSFFFADFSFSCDGVEQEPITFETKCRRWDRLSNEWSSLSGRRYYQAHGISDVALSIVSYAKLQSPPRLWPMRE